MQIDNAAAQTKSNQTGFSAAMLAERQSKLAGLYTGLQNARDQSEGSELENRIWQIWVTGPNQKITGMMAAGMAKVREYNLDAAREIFSAVIEMSPDYAEGWNERAHVYFLQERYDKSLADLDHTLQLEPRHFAAHAGRFLVLEKLGRKTEAQAALQQAVAIHPYIRERSLLVK